MNKEKALRKAEKLIETERKRFQQRRCRSARLFTDAQKKIDDRFLWSAHGGRVCARLIRERICVVYAPQILDGWQDDERGAYCLKNKDSRNFGAGKFTVRLSFYSDEERRRAGEAIEEIARLRCEYYFHEFPQKSDGSAIYWLTALLVSHRSGLENYDIARDIDARQEAQEEQEGGAK